MAKLEEMVKAADKVWAGAMATEVAPHSGPNSVLGITWFRCRSLRKPQRRKQDHALNARAASVDAK